MIVFGLDIKEFECTYRLDGPFDEAKGVRFQKNAIHETPMDFIR